MPYLMITASHCMSGMYLLTVKVNMAITNKTGVLMIMKIQIVVVWAETVVWWVLLLFEPSR
jgi:hypothetical protein